MPIDQIDAFMAAIRNLESGGNYSALGPNTQYGRASGAYQFLDSTWGGYMGYASARDAPAHVQDQRARELMTQYYRQFGDWGAVAVAWHAGPGRADDYLRGELSSDVSDGYTSTLDYAARVLTDMGIDPGDTGGDPQGVQMAKKEKIPSGGVLLRTLFAPVIRFELFPGVYVDFIADPALVDLEGSGYNIADADLWHEPDGSLIPAATAGHATELATLVEQGYTDLQSWMQDTIGVLFSPNNPAWDDPQVQRIFAEWLADPDLTPEVIMGRIRHETDYWQEINRRQSDWFEASHAEQDRLTQEQAALIQQSMWDLAGVRPPMTDTQLLEWAEAVASGQMTMGQVNEEIRTIARENDESPLSRAERAEEEEQRQRGIDIENQTGAIRDLAANWGIEMTDGAMSQWARDIVENVKSAEDFETFLRTQAAVLYPWMDPESTVATIDQARPWLTAKQQILETGELSLFDDDIQRALQEGTSLADFRRQLKSDPRWKQTRNYTETATAALTPINAELGFA